MTSAMLITMLLGFALSVSVAVSIGLASIVGIQVVHAPMLISVKEMFNALNKFPLAAIPFFILAGNLMETAASRAAWWTLPRAWSAACRAACP
jgi:TRAP-type mannitol/chloroaromatic compound transport system permease large subunit